VNACWPRHFRKRRERRRGRVRGVPLRQSGGAPGRRNERPRLEDTKWVELRGIIPASLAQLTARSRPVRRCDVGALTRSSRAWLIVGSRDLADASGLPSATCRVPHRLWRSWLRPGRRHKLRSGPRSRIASRRKKQSGARRQHLRSGDARLRGGGEARRSNCSTICLPAS
jgi:hypothetical protein